MATKIINKAVSAGAAIDTALNFPAYSVRIDNLTAQWWHVIDVDAWIQPYTVGSMVRLNGAYSPNIKAETPAGQTSTVITTEQATFTFSSEPSGDSPGQFIPTAFTFNIAALGTLNVNIAAQTLGTVNVNLSSSSITLNVNISSSSVTLNVNIASSAVTLNVNITGSVLLNINISSSSITLNVNITGSVTLNVNITGSVTLNVNISSSSVTLNVNIVASGVTLNVNIASSAITVNVNITASSATISVNLTAQTIVLSARNPEQRNLVANGNWESGFSGWNLAAIVGAPAQVVDGVRPHSGTVSLRTVMTAGTSLKWDSTPFPVRAGTLLSWGYWGYSDGAGPSSSSRANVLFYTATGTLISTVNGGFLAAAGSWRSEYNVPTVVPATATYAIFEIEVTGGVGAGATSIFTDDCFVANASQEAIDQYGLAAAYTDSKYFARLGFQIIAFGITPLVPAGGGAVIANYVVPAGKSFNVLGYSARPGLVGPNFGLDLQLGGAGSISSENNGLIFDQPVVAAAGTVVGLNVINQTAVGIVYQGGFWGYNV